MQFPGQVLWPALKKCSPDDIKGVFMKANSLRKPLISTAILLILLLTMFSLTLAHPEITFWQSLGLLIIGILRGIQWFLALFLGVLFCIAFLFAIFFGAVALISKKESARLYATLQETLRQWWQPALALLPQCRMQPTHEQPMPEKVYENIHAIQTQVHDTKELLSAKIEGLSKRIDTLEELTNSMADSNQLETLRKEVQGAVDSLTGIQGAVDTMKSCVEQTATQLDGISAEKILGDLPARLQSLEEQPQQPMIDISPLENDIAVIQQELVAVREKADKALASATPLEKEEKKETSVQVEQAFPETEEYRIFNYFDDPADKVKVAEMVDAALEKNMNYKQIIESVVKGLGPKKGKIVSSHPSLIKEYIRSCRRMD
jgi:predicted  nucleic acid-binding Zn-ribbon protein